MNFHLRLNARKTHSIKEIKRMRENMEEKSIVFDGLIFNPHSKMFSLIRNGKKLPKIKFITRSNKVSLIGN